MVWVCLEGDKGKGERRRKFEHSGTGEQFECLDAGKKSESLWGWGTGKFPLR